MMDEIKLFDELLDHLESKIDKAAQIVVEQKKAGNAVHPFLMVELKMHLEEIEFSCNNTMAAANVCPEFMPTADKFSNIVQKCRDLLEEMVKDLLKVLE